MSETFAELHTIARRVSLPVYTVPEIFPPTIENQRIFWQGWDSAYYQFELYTEALARNDRAYALAPQHPPVLVHRGSILSGLGRTEEALQMYTASLAVLPPEDHQGRKVALHQQASLLGDLLRFTEADVAYAAALREMPDAADTWFNRAVDIMSWGRSEMQTGQVTAGREHLRAALGYAQEAQRLGYRNPQLPTLIALIQAALRQVQG